MRTVQDWYSMCSLIWPDLNFYWSIINLALQPVERKWLWRVLLSSDPRDSPCFIFGLHGMVIGRWRLNQFPSTGSLAGVLGWARLCCDTLEKQSWVTWGVACGARKCIHMVLWNVALTGHHALYGIKLQKWDRYTKLYHNKISKHNSLQRFYPFFPYLVLV